MEQWCWIPEYEGLYRVSVEGIIWSMPRKHTHGGILKQIPDKRNYRWITLTKDGRQQRYQVHRLVLFAFDRFPGEGEECRHLDGNPANNNRSNLTWGTRGENMQDMLVHGTHANSNKACCPSGHEYTEENTYQHPDGRRFCRLCSRANGLRIYYAKKAAGTTPRYSDLTGEKLERTRELARERARNYRERKRNAN